MDLYTTSFTLPHTAFHITHTSSPISTSLPLPDSTGPSDPSSLAGAPIVTPPPPTSYSSTSTITAAQAEKDWEAVQNLVIDITTREGCLVTVTREQPGSTSTSFAPAEGSSDDTAPSSPAVWNFHFSGSYQSVMAARGAVLREYPRDNRFALKVPRADILESPLAALSSLKAEVQRRLNGIAAETRAEIAVVNLATLGGAGGGEVLGKADGDTAGSEPAGSVKGHSKRHSGESASSVTGSADGPSTASVTLSKASATAESKEAETAVPATYGLETERMCEIVITGRLESVGVAKVLVLVLLDEITGLHVEACDIDYKLHAIIGGRRRTVIQSIQEETATNIYYPVPLVGILDRPQPGTSQHHSISYRSLQPGYGNSSSGGSMMPMSSQNTGMTQMTGYSQTPSSGMSMGMGNGWHMGGPASQGHSSVGGQPSYPQVGRQQPIYHPNHQLQYPYHPHQQSHNNYDHNAQRGMQHAGPAAYGHHYQQHQHQAMPVAMQHTGMSSMTGYQTPRGMSPRHLGVGGHYNQHQQTQHYNNHHNQHNQHFNIGHQHHGYDNNQHQPQYMSGTHSSQPPPMVMNPYAGTYGHSHVHVGLGGGQMGMSNGPGVEMGMNGNGTPHGQSAGMGMGGNVGMNTPGQYGQGPHPGLAVHGGEQGSLGKANQIWITGEFFGVQRARDMLLNVAMQKSKLVISRDTAILPRKLDWLLTERLDEVKAIMSDNGTYLQVPSVGSQASLITVFGDHRVNIERTIRSIMALACQFYVASVWLLPLAFDVMMAQPTLNPAQMQPVLKRVAHATGAEVVFKSNCFEMHGTEEEVRAAVFMVLELDIINGFHHEIRFQIELANEHREFISGKKNGKINKIMKLAGVKIKFETFNDYNFLMDVAGSDIGSLHGLSMLQEELPAELSFHIPESYHKRIIGVAGKNIQRIMKLYGVYVKFSNAEEFAALGGYADNEDNVVARTPAKNAVNLESLKQSIMELVIPKDKDYTTEAISVPRRYHRTLLGDKSIFIHDIERKTNSRVSFPYKESASDIITIFGPESQIHIAAAMLLDHVPFEADLHVPPNPELTTLVSSTDFIHFAERVKREHQIAISPSAKFGHGDEAVFKFRCQRSNIDVLTTARDALEEFLEQHNIQVYPAGAEKRVDSFADAFDLFNSRLLSARAKAAKQAVHHDGTFVPPAHIRSRPIPTDVKALFDGPAHSGVPDDMSSNGNGGRGFAGPFSYHDPRRTSTADFWQTQSPQPIRSDLTPIATTAEPSKRESDPLIQEKVRQATIGPGVPLGPHHVPGHNHPRGGSARTQSLDITSLNFSRTLSSNAGGFGALPASPAAMLGNSPNTASGQYFPSTSSVAGSKGYQSGIDNITSSLGNIHV